MEKRDQISFINPYIANFALMIGLSLWRSLFKNFAVEEVYLSASQIGVFQAVRKIPGPMGFGVALIVMFIAEVRLTYLSVALLGFGLVLIGKRRSMIHLMRISTYRHKGG